MTNTWQTYQKRLAELLENQPVPAPNWGRRPALTPHSPTSPAGDGRDEQIISLPPFRETPKASPHKARALCTARQ